MRGALLAAAAVAATPLAAEIRFEDRSDALPAHEYAGGWEHFVGGGAATFDCSGDGLPEIFVSGGAAPAALYRNLGDFAFAPAALPELTGTTGAYPLDLDGDGVLDLFVMRVGPNVALRGLGDCAFEDATAAMGLPAGDAWTTAFTAWWDAGATRPTLAVGNYVDRDNPDGPFGACDVNQILWPEAAGGWREETLAPGFCPLSMLATRNAEGEMALRLSNDRHYYVRGGAEQMWSIAERRFLGPEDGWPTVSLWGMGIASRDVTGDGRAEVMLTSMGDQLLQIAGADGSYSAAAFALGTTAHRPHVGDDGRPSTGWHAEFADVDNDGRADLFIAKGNLDQMPDMAIADPNNLLQQMPDGTFREVSVEAGVATMERSRGAALEDFDGDGRLDLLVVNRRAPLELYRNVTEGAGNWLALDLAAPGPNRFAVGAVVTVRTADTVQVIDVTVGGGHAGGQAGPVHVGIGAAGTAEVEVRWPDGQVTSATLAPGRHALTPEG